MLRAFLLFGVLIPGIAQAQLLTPNIPPLPQEERLIPRGGLSVTLRVSPDRIAVDEVPTFTLAIRNTSSRRMLLNPAITNNIRIFDNAGAFVAPPINALADYSLRSVRAAELIALEPGATHEVRVYAQHHHPEDFGRIGMYSDPSSTRPTTTGLSLRPGSYAARFGYRSLQDYGSRYAEPMPADLWEGTIETSPTPFTVLALVRSQIDRLNAEIDGSGLALDAAKLSSVARANETIDAWLRRFSRLPDDRGTAVTTIVGIGNPDGMRRLLDLAMALPGNERQALIMQSGPKPGLEAPECTGVPWLLIAAPISRSREASSLDAEWRDVSARCPGLLTGLRASVQQPLNATRTDWGGEANARANALESLARLGDRNGLPLLLTIARGQRPAGVQPNVSRDFETVRGGALRGLAILGGEEAAQAILERLRATASDTFATRDAVELAGRLPLLEATPLLIELLATKDPTLSFTAMRALEQRGGRAVVPAIEMLLAHPERIIRQNAAGFLRRAGGPVSLPLMREAARDGDIQVRSVGLFHLAQRGDSSDLPSFLANVTAPPAQGSALQGIDRFGTAQTFTPLRTLLDTATQDSRRLVMSALQQLTFAPIWRDASEWDTWLARHSTLTRADWAREALASNATAAFSTNALEYLARSGQLSSQILERAVTSGDANLRLTAARIVGESDPRRAVLLMVRELENRSLYACQRAMKELNTLAVSSDQVDCTSLVERESARKRWIARAQTLRP